MISSRQAKALARRHPDYKEPTADRHLRIRLEEIYDLIKGEATKGKGKLLYLLDEEFTSPATTDFRNALLALGFMVDSKGIGPNTSVIVRWS